MRCPRCELFCAGIFGLEVHMAQEHPLDPANPLSQTPRVVREFEPIKREHARYPLLAANPNFPGVDIDSIHRNPRYAAPHKG